MTQPVKKFRAGALQATIWNNETTKDGETVIYPTITFERSYKDKEGEWKHTNSLRVGDLPKATMILNKAYEYLAMASEEA